MKGAGFCLLYQGFYYIEVYYIESRVYYQNMPFFTKIDITTLSYIALVIVHIQIQYLFSQIHTSKQDSSDDICPILYLLWALAYWLLAIVLFVDLQVLQLLNF